MCRRSWSASSLLLGTAVFYFQPVDSWVFPCMRLRALGHCFHPYRRPSEKAVQHSISITQRRSERRPLGSTMASTSNIASSEIRDVDAIRPQSVSASATARATRTRDIPACAERLINGGLVAFPTETVYGLGCHALNSTAIQSVFDAKERPLTDPLIVHVLSRSDACRLWKATALGTSTTTDTTNEGNMCNGAVSDDAASSRLPSSHLEATILRALCDGFWPGPLTIVAKAAENVVPSKIMAGTGFCAIRSPRHVTARALLEAANIPIAAPSANKFGHVSPTTANHVWDDLQYESVWILEDDNVNDNQRSTKTHTTCDVGVESTVAKVEARISAGDEARTAAGTYDVTILRQGAVSVHDLTQCLERSGLRIGVDVCVSTKKKQQVSPDDEATVAPGQLLRHYSPNVPSFLVTPSCIQQELSTVQNLLKKSVVLDYGGLLQSWQPFALEYRDFSPTANSTEAAQTVFDALRWAEQIPDAERILFPDLDIGASSSDALLLALKDRLTRAASGNSIDNL